MPLFPDQASSFAPHVDALYIFLVLLTAFFSLLIGTLVVVFAIKYRRRADNEVPALIHEVSAIFEGGLRTLLAPTLTRSPPLPGFSHTRSRTPRRRNGCASWWITASPRVKR